MTNVIPYTLAGQGGASGVTIPVAEIDSNFSYLLNRVPNFPASTSATPGSVMKIDFLYEVNADSPLVDLAGIWTGDVYTFFGISKEFTLADGGSTNGPYTALMTNAVSSNSPAAVVGIIPTAAALHDGAEIFGANIIARTDPGLDDIKACGLEIDLAFGVGVTNPHDSIGLAINIFNVAASATGIQLGGGGGGTWSNGILISSIAPNGTGFGASGGAGIMDSLINSTQGTFGSAAIILGNTHRFRWNSGMATGLCDLFIQDNGGGKTQLMAQFSTGGPVQIAVQA